MNPVNDKLAVFKERYRQEVEAQKTAVDPEDIPIAYELISSGWLSKILCANYPGCEVVAHSLDVADQGTSDRRRIFLQYNDAGTKAGLPATVFCKATQRRDSRFLIGLNGCAEGEVNFYNNIRPVLDINAPLAIFANADKESLNSIIVLQDLAGKAEFCDHRTDISLQQAKSQLRLLAKLHGKFQGATEQDEVLASYPTLEDFYQTTEKSINWSDKCIRGFEEARAHVPERLYRRVAEIWPATERAFMLCADLPRTLIHGDVHLKNWYITANGEMGLSDWQCCARGHWSRDVAYTLATSLSIENRRAWETELMRYYLEKLSDEGVAAISLDDAMRFYRQQLLTALASWTATYASSTRALVQPAETCVEFIRRIACAMDDLDALSAV